MYLLPRTARIYSMLVKAISIMLISAYTPKGRTHNQAYRLYIPANKG